MESHGKGRAVVFWAAAEAPEVLQLALSDPERARAERYRSREAKSEFVTGALLVRAVAALVSGTSLEKAEIARVCPGCLGEHGPPRMVAATEWSISVAHSCGKVGVAAARAARVGLDLERMAEGLDPALVRSVCAPAEIEELYASTESGRAARFTELWCRKEAILKAYGRGLTVPPSAVGAWGERPVLDGARSAGLRLAPGAGWLPLTAPWDGFAAALFAATPTSLVNEVLVPDPSALLRGPGPIAALMPMLPAR